MNKINQTWNFQGCWIMAPERNYGKEDSLYYQKHHNSIVKKIFTLDHVECSYLYVAVLGYYIAYINGKRVGDYELNSDWVNYQKCLYYDVYDITSFLHEGENCITFALGNGMYNPAPLLLFGKYNLRNTLAEVGEPRIICDVVSKDKMIVSTDATWQYRWGNTIFNNLYLGETVDYSYTCETWNTVITETKSRNFKPSMIPKVKRHQYVKPIATYEREDGIIYDFGETVSGFISMKWEAQEKQTITIQYSECMRNNKLDFHTCLAGSVGHTIGATTIKGGLGSPKQAIQTDKVISKEGVNTFTNQFSYHSFRYALVSNIAKKQIHNISAIYVYSDIQQVGTIAMDNTYYQELYDVATRTKLNNIHSTFEDCARERLGYGGDMVALATSNLFLFDIDKLLEKVIIDFRMEQTTNGGIPETAPYMGIQTNGTGEGEGPILWQFVLPYLLAKHYQYYGNKELVVREYPYVKKQMQYLLSYDLEKLVHRCLGDHGSMLIAGNFRQSTPDKELIGYCTVLLFLKYNIYLSNIVGDQMPLYSKKYKQIQELILRKFLNADGTFGEGTQSGLAFVTMLELQDGAMLCKQLVEKIKQDNYVFNSGIFGMMLSYEVLHLHGYDDIIEKWLLKVDAPSFNDMLKTGNKVLSELFIGTEQSMNHAMFASYQQWYYQGLAGIRVMDHAIGFNRIHLRPYFSPYINTFNCKVKTTSGCITSAWERNSNRVTWTIKIPMDIKYTIEIPKGYTLLSRTEENREITIDLTNNHK